MHLLFSVFVDFDCIMANLNICHLERIFLFSFLHLYWVKEWNVLHILWGLVMLGKCSLKIFSMSGNNCIVGSQTPTSMQAKTINKHRKCTELCQIVSYITSIQSWVYESNFLKAEGFLIRGKEEGGGSDTKCIERFSKCRNIWCSHHIPLNSL